MRKNLLKQLILALLITVAVPTLTAQVHVGDILCEGNAIISPANYPSSGATAIGVVSMDGLWLWRMPWRTREYVYGVHKSKHLYQTLPMSVKPFMI